MKLADLLKFGAARSNVIPSILQFPSIDTDGMAKRMRLAERALAQAKRDLPASDSRSLDGVEQDIVNEIGGEAKSQFDRYQENQKTYADRAGSLAIQSLLVQMGAAADDAIADFANRTRNGANVLYLDRKRVIETEQELERFRKKHGVERPARQIKSRVLSVGFLLLIVLAESIANGLFLQRGSTFGLLGGIGLATIIACINVAIGVFAGRIVFPWISHKNWSIGILAFTASAAYVAAAIGFNLLVAHYRTAMIIDPLNAAQLAMKTLKNSPFEIDDIQSWMLFAMGVIFSIAAAIDGWLMDDPYPGYGRVTREHQEAVDLYTEQKAELLGELAAIKNIAEDVIERCIRDIEIRRGEYDSILAKSTALREAIAEHFGHLESAANTLLQFYRDENRKHRKTPPPSRFDERWTHNPPAFERQAILERLREQIDAALAKAMDEAPLQRKRLHDAYLASMGEYRRIDELTARDIAK